VLKDGAYAASYHASGAPFANRIHDAPSDAALHALIDQVTDATGAVRV